MSLLGRSLACLVLVSAVSCSATSPAAASHPRAEAMPAGASWRGIYQGPYHIMLNIWAQGGRARGNWRALGDREGVFTGRVRGNLLQIDWNEHALNGGAAWSGTGYFVYSAGKSGKPDQIFGQWSMGRTGATSSWWAVKRVTRDSAVAIGLTDRGIVAPGYKADLNVIDYDNLSLRAPEVVYDLPSGGKRLIQRANGYEATIVSGVPVYRNGEATGALPGRLVRGAR